MQRASIASYSDKWSLRAKWPRWSSRPTSPAVIMMQGDMRETLRALADNSIDSVVTDPPYHLTSIVKRFGSATAAPAKVGATGAYERASRGFMGQQWDGGDVAFQPETWAEIWRVLKPGGHMVAFSGTRTYHRMVCAIEDAGFEIRDQLAWAYGSGFPKSHNMGEGRGTALKPAWEPICLARKPLEGTVAANIAKWGTGALNIDGCRIVGEAVKTFDRIAGNRPRDQYRTGVTEGPARLIDRGRWPANFCHDGSDEVLQRFPANAGARAPVHQRNGDKFRNAYGAFKGNIDEAGSTFQADSGSAARFFKICEGDFEAWLNANSAESILSLQSLFDVFVQSDAVIAEYLAGSQLSVLLERPSMNVTPSESRLIRETLIGAIRIAVNAFWQESPPDELTLSLNRVPFVVHLTPTAIILTIPNLSISSGCAGRAIFSIMPPNLVLGDRAWRFKYCAKASKSERGEGNNHPTVKPVALMEWLVRMVTPPGGLVLDPFMGSGSTAVAVQREGFRFVGCELSADYIAIARGRLAA